MGPIDWRSRALALHEQCKWLRMILRSEVHRKVILVRRIEEVERARIVESDWLRRTSGNQIQERFGGCGNLAPIDRGQ